MKTTKVILVAMLMALATIGFSQVESKIKTEAPPAQKSALIQLDEALQIPGMRMAIYRQVTPGMVTKTIPYYVVPIKFNHRIYNVAGTYGQWMNFFRIRPLPIKKES
ncbi:MAG: hypothetical protein R2764_03245 [Bacteroidales bacterium]